MTDLSPWCLHVCSELKQQSPNHRKGFIQMFGQIVLHDFMKPLSVKHQKQVLQIYANVCGVKLSSDCAVNEKGNCSGLCCFEPVDMNGIVCVLL